MCHRVVWHNSTDILEECSAFILKVKDMLSKSTELETGLHDVILQKIVFLTIKVILGVGSSRMEHRVVCWT
jgi:hypothetical protein